MSSLSRSSFTYYEQSELSLPSVSVAATGRITTSRIHFSQPIELHKIGFIQNGTAVNAATSIRWAVVDGPVSTTVIRNSGHLVVPTLLASANGIGHWTELNVDGFGPLRVDPGEGLMLDVVVAGAGGQTIMPSFLYRTFGWNSPGLLGTDGSATTVDRLVNMDEVTAV